MTQRREPIQAVIDLIDGSIYEATAVGQTVQSKTPIFALCRALVAASVPDGPMVVHDRAGNRRMVVASIHLAATLTVIENDKHGPRIGRFVPFNLALRGTTMAGAEA